MARGNDLSTTLDAKEVARLRSLLADNPVFEPAAGSKASYPRMLFHGDYLKAQQDWRLNPAPELKKIAAERMTVCTHIVMDPDEEEEFLLDGWKRSPADFLDAANDPRIPVGREARRAAVQQELTREERIRELRLQLAELTGRVDPTDVREDAVAPTPAVRVARRRKMKRRKRPSQLAAKRAAVALEPAEQS